MMNYAGSLLSFISHFVKSGGILSSPLCRPWSTALFRKVIPATLVVFESLHHVCCVPFGEY